MISPCGVCATLCVSKLGSYLFVSLFLAVLATLDITAGGSQIEVQENVISDGDRLHARQIRQEVRGKILFSSVYGS